MDCRPESLQDYLYGFLDCAEDLRAREHLDACARCRAVLERLEKERDVLARAALGATGAPARSRTAILFPLAFAAAVLLGLLWTLLPSDTPDGPGYGAPTAQEKGSEKEKSQPADEAAQIEKLEKVLKGTTDEQERQRLQASIDNLRLELQRRREGKTGKSDAPMPEKLVKKGPTKADELTKALDKNPDDVASLVARAEEYLNTKKWEESAKDARRAVELAPDNAKAHYVLGRACRTLKLNDEADKALSRAAQLDPRLSGEIAHYKQTSKVQQELDAVYGKIKMSTDPDEKMRLEMRVKELGQELKLLSQGEGVIINLKEVEIRLQKNPDDVAALVDRAIHYLDHGKAEPALKDLDRAIELKADHAPAHLKRAIAHAMKGDMKRAWADSKRGEELDPKNMKAVDYTNGTIKKLFSAQRDKQRPAAEFEQEIAALKDRLEELRGMSANADLPQADRDRARKEADRVQGEIDKLATELKARPPEPVKKVQKK